MSGKHRNAVPSILLPLQLSIKQVAVGCALASSLVFGHFVLHNIHQARISEAQQQDAAAYIQNQPLTYANPDQAVEILSHVFASGREQLLRGNVIIPGQTYDASGGVIDSLPQALAAAQKGDTILLPPGFSAVGSFTISRDINIIAAAPGTVTLLADIDPATGLRSAFQLTDTSGIVVMDGLNITGVYGAEGGSLISATLNANVTRNRADVTLTNNVLIAQRLEGVDATAAPVDIIHVTGPNARIINNLIMASPGIRNGIVLDGNNHFVRGNIIAGADENGIAARGATIYIGVGGHNEFSPQLEISEDRGAGGIVRRAEIDTAIVQALEDLLGLPEANALPGNGSRQAVIERAIALRVEGGNIILRNGLSGIAYDPVSGYWSTNAIRGNFVAYNGEAEIQLTPPAMETATANDQFAVRQFQNALLQENTLIGSHPCIIEAAGSFCADFLAGEAQRLSQLPPPSLDSALEK